MIVKNLPVAMPLDPRRRAGTAQSCFPLLQGFGVVVVSLLICLAANSVSGAGRINQEGRILGTLPVVTNAILFNTSNADSVVAAMQIMPVTNAWNEDVSRLPVLVNSDAMMEQISADLSSSRRTLRVFQEMNFVLTPDAQPLVPISFVDYPDESDLNGGTSPTGLYPIPSNLPIETWPSQTGALTLSQWQQDVNNTGGDRHAIIVQPGAGLSWEMWQAKLTGANWQSSNGARFDLNSGAYVVQQNTNLASSGWNDVVTTNLPGATLLISIPSAFFRVRGN